MIKDTMHPVDMSRLLPGLIYEMTTVGPWPQGPSLARLPGAVESPGGDRGRSDLAHLGLGPGSEPVPGYHLVSRIGQGSTGEVWKAFGPGGFPVAMKFIGMGERDADDELHSLCLMKDIRHANLLTIFGTWELDGLLVVGMDLADGTLLDRCGEAIGRGEAGIPPDELASYMEQAARAIDFLNQPIHRLLGRDDVGLLHRDIKPQNLLLVGGSVKLGDFGLVTPIEGPVEVRDLASLAPAYTPPEWLEGRISRRSDQYGLAMTYCRLSGGCLPVPLDDGGPVAVAPGERDLSMFPASQRPVLARALATNPEDRWPDCLTFVQELTRVIPAKSAGPVNLGSGTMDRLDSDLIELPFALFRGRNGFVAAGLLTLLLLTAGRWFHQAPSDLEPAGVYQAAHVPEVPESSLPDLEAIGLDPSSVEAIAPPSASSITRAEVVATIGAMTAPARSQVRLASESLRRFLDSLEQARSAGGAGVKPDLASQQGFVPDEILAERPLVAEPVETPEQGPASGLVAPEVPTSSPSRLVAVAERLAIGPETPSKEVPGKAKVTEVALRAKEQGLPEPLEVSRPRVSTITIFLPNPNGELVVRGDVGRGNPDEWYGPKRVIHSPPLSEEKDYLVGSFWTDEEGRPQTRSKELKVKPGRAYEVDLRTQTPTSKEVDRASLISGLTERK